MYVCMYTTNKKSKGEIVNRLNIFFKTSLTQVERQTKRRNEQREKKTTQCL